MTFFTQDMPRPSIWDKVADVFYSVVDAQSRARQVQELSEKSDQQLADLGIERSDIIRHVFRDTYYL